MNPELLKLMEILFKVNEAYKAAQQRTQDAAGREQRALYVVNMAQQNIDDQMALLRADAPFNSTWWKVRQRK